MQGYSDDEVRNAAEIREWLTKLISEKQDEIDKIKITLALIDTVLKQGSFKTASNLGLSKKFSSVEQNKEEILEKKEYENHLEKKEKKEKEKEEQMEETRYIKRIKDNSSIARVYISNENVEIIPEDAININIGTPPFRSFFLNRILHGMKTKDLDKVNQGQLSESDIISFDITTEKDNDILRKISIKNYREKERVNEIFNTAAWVFTRMLEKSGK